MRRVSEQLNQVSRLLHELQSQRRDAGLEQLTASPKLHTTMKDLRVAEAQLLEKNQTLCEALFAMEAERKLYCDLFDLAPDGYLVTDEAGTILETNRAMVELLGADADAVVNTSIDTLFLVADRPAFRDFLMNIRAEAAMLDHPVVWQKEMAIRFKATIPVLARCSISSGRGSNTKVIRWIFRDLTEQKRAEEIIERASQSLETSVHDRTVQLEEKILELESFHDVVVGRELRLIELEQEVDRLRHQIGKYEHGEEA